MSRSRITNQQLAEALENLQITVTKLGYDWGATLQVGNPFANNSIHYLYQRDPKNGTVYLMSPFGEVSWPSKREAFHGLWMLHRSLELAAMSPVLFRP